MKPVMRPEPLWLFSDELCGIVAGIGDQGDNLIVGGLLAGMLALPDHQRRLAGIVVFERDAADFLLTHGSGDGELDDPAQGNDLTEVLVRRLDDGIKLVLCRLPVPLLRVGDETDAVEGNAGEADLIGRHGDAMDGGGVLENGADETDINADGDRAGALLGPALGELDERVAGDVGDAIRAEVVLEAEQGGFLAAPEGAANVPEKFCVLLDISVDTCVDTFLLWSWGVRENTCTIKCIDSVSRP